MQNTGLLNWENTWNEKTSGTDLLLPPVPLLPSKLGRELEPLYQGGKTQLLKLSPLLLEAAEVASGNRKVVHLHASELEQPELLLLPARCANGAVLVSSSETQLVPKSLLTLVFCWKCEVLNYFLTFSFRISIFSSVVIMGSMNTSIKHKSAFLKKLAKSHFSFLQEGAEFLGYCEKECVFLNIGVLVLWSSLLTSSIITIQLSNCKSLASLWSHCFLSLDGHIPKEKTQWTLWWLCGCVHVKVVLWKEPYQVC